MKMMRFSRRIFLIIALVIFFSLCTGCILSSSSQNQTLGNNTTTPENEGFNLLMENSNSHPPTYTIRDAESALKDYQYRMTVSSQPVSYFYIRGVNVDISGNAEHWIFGTREENRTTMQVFDSNGIREYSFNGSMPSGQVIDTDTILSPADAIKTAYPAFQNATGSFDLEITNGKYILIGPAGEQSHEYIINATTGVLSEN
jgi:hypothetical protein